MATAQINRIVEHLRHAGLSDGQLLDGFIARRDEAAFEMLVRRHGPMVLGVCQRVLGNPHDAEDAFQATFLVLVRKAASVKPRELVGNWLYGVAYQTAVRARASAAKRHTRETAMNPMPEATAPPGDIWHDLQPLLDKELARLGDKYRVPIVLCDLEGKTRKEAADQLGVPEGTINSRLARGRTMLAERLTRQGVTLSAGALAALLTQQAASASVPASLLLATVQAMGGSVSANAALLADGVVKTMFLAKLGKVSACVLFFVAACGIGLIGHAGLGVESNASADPKKPPAVEKKTPPAFKPRTKEDADKLRERFKANADSFEITIERRLPKGSQIDLRTITLHASNRRFEPSVLGPSGKPIFKSARITKEQALKIIKALDDWPLFMFRTGFDASRPWPTDAPDIRVEIGYGPDSKPGPRLRRGESWGWHMIGFSVTLGECVDGEAAKIVNELFGAMLTEPPLHKNDLQKLEGTWLAVSGEQNGAKLPDADLKAAISKLVFKVDAGFPGNTLTWHKGNDAGNTQKFKIDPDQTPRQITFDGTRKGIYEVNGDTLKLCVHFPFRGAGDLNFPKTLDGKGKPLLVVFKRQPQNARDKIQGSWKSDRFELDGAKLDHVGSFLTFKDDTFHLRYGKAAWEGTFNLDASGEPKRIDLTVTSIGDGAANSANTWRGKHWQGIYVFEGDRLMIRLGKDRPKGFAGKKAADEELHVLRRIDADASKDPPPKK